VIDYSSGAKVKPLCGRASSERELGAGPHDPGIAMRRFDGTISNARRSNRGHGSRADHDASDINRSIPDVPGMLMRTWARDRASQQRRDGGSGGCDPDHFRTVGIGADPEYQARRLENWNVPRSSGTDVRVEIPPKVIDRQLDESEFEIFWEAAERYGWWFASIRFEAAPERSTFQIFLGNLVGNLYDTGLAAALAESMAEC